MKILYGIQATGNGHITRSREVVRLLKERGHDDLTDCSGVIANAGFARSSESLYLGKKLLVKPLEGQLEQESNGLALESFMKVPAADRSQPQPV